MYKRFLGASRILLKVVYLVELKTSSNFEKETFMLFQSYTFKIIFRNLPGAPDPDPGSGKRNVGLFRSHTNANKEIMNHESLMKYFSFMKNFKCVFDPDHYL